MSNPELKKEDFKIIKLWAKRSNWGKIFINDKKNKKVLLDLVKDVKNTTIQKVLDKIELILEKVETKEGFVTKNGRIYQMGLDELKVDLEKKNVRRDEKMKFEKFVYKELLLREMIKTCQKKGHVHQVAFSTYENAFTQVCFCCKTIRTTFNKNYCCGKKVKL